MFYSIKRYSAMVLLGLILFTGLSAMVPGAARAAEPSIAIQSETGFDGKLKMNEWSPLTITLTSDRDISGELVVRTEIPYNGTSVSHVKQVDLPAGTAKTVTFGIVGNTFDRNNSEIRFYEGSAESGKYIPFASGRLTSLQSTAVRGTIIGVLAADPDSMNFLATLSASGNDAKVVVPLKSEQIPEDGILLSALDVLVLNNFPADTLTAKQTEAIRSWVSKGGSLVLGGGQDYPKTAQGFEDLSPVEWQGGADVTALPELAKAGGKPLELSGPFPLSAAKLKEGAKEEIAAGIIPMFASWDVGKGKVHYAAYDLAMDPLYQWRGHAEVWNRVLREEFSANNGTMYGNVPTGNLMSDFGYLLDYFPSLTLPPFSLLFWLLLGYAVIVAPLLYYVLKKFDKREWAWGLIPLIAVIASGGIYLAGTSGKSSTRAHTLSIVEMDGKGGAVRSVASALFVPRGGTYNLTFPAGTYVSVSREDGLLQGGQDGSNRQLLRVKEDATEVKLRDAAHRSITKLWPDRAEVIESGALNIKASYDDKGLQGTVTNGTNYDLSGAALLAPGEIYILGDIPKGKSVTLPAASSAAYNDYGSALFPYASNNQDDYLLERQRGMVNVFMNQAASVGKYVLIAWNRDAQNEYQVNGENPATEQLNMYTQYFEPNLEQNGKVVIPYGLIGARISGTTSSEWSKSGTGRVDMSPGEMTLEYELPKNTETHYSQLKLRWSFPTGLAAMIWNEKNQQWESMERTNGNEMDFSQDSDFYINSGYLKIKITAEEWSAFDLPEISLTGSVAQ
ncbi:hypothetical protein V3851_14600 [Paenibacillus sp. M1]|uniref:DUF7408 domain-containing protein n=1 Tax=Paenibacillus haidiansis TaxID=1574488 RepID=A0ABU7VTH2_9BACL